MRRVALAAGAAAVAVVAGVVLLPGGGDAGGDARAAAPATAGVQAGPLTAVVSAAGTLAYRARPDGSPFLAVGRAPGTYTRLPAVGDTVGCGEVLYRVDERPVLLVCGRVPAYRALRPGDRGADVRALNRTLRVRGGGAVFTAGTRRALQARQRRTGARADGALALGEAVVLPAPARVAKVLGGLGEPARPGAPVLAATSGTLHVLVGLEPSDQRRVRRGDRVQVTLPGSRVLPGRVTGFGRVATPSRQGDGATEATVPTAIALDRPGRVRGLDGTPVQVAIRTAGVRDALSVPVTALLGVAGGGYGVEVVRDEGRHDVVAVRPGLFDDAAGRVQVLGALHAGDRVVVPSP